MDHAILEIIILTCIFKLTEIHVPYTTHTIHMKLHLGPEWHIIHILTFEDINDVIFNFSTVACANISFSI